MIKKLGEGTFSEVFKAQVIKTGELVAVKCMKKKIFKYWKNKFIKRNKSTKKIIFPQKYNKLIRSNFVNKFILYNLY